MQTLSAVVFEMIGTEYPSIYRGGVDSQTVKNYGF